MTSNSIVEWQFYAALQTYRRTRRMPEVTNRQYLAKAAEYEYCNRQINYLAQTISWTQLEHLVVDVLPLLPREFSTRLGTYLHNNDRVAEMTTSEALHFATYLPGHRNNAFTEAFRVAA